MSGIAINVNVVTDLPAELAAKAAQLAPATLHREIAAPLVRFTKSHLLKVNADRPNILGGRRTNFYAGAARSTTWQADANAATITIEHQGFAQRLHGGTIRPVKAKNLAIPANAEAYGRSPRESRVPLVWALVGGKRPALVARENFMRTITKGKRAGKEVADYSGKGTRGAFTVMYWLVKSVTQRADRSVLPTDQEYADTATAHLTRYLDRLLARQGGAA
jgi:hypothetical protein